MAVTEQATAVKVISAVMLVFTRIFVSACILISLPLHSYKILPMSDLLCKLFPNTAAIATGELRSFVERNVL